MDRAALTDFLSKRLSTVADEAAKRVGHPLPKSSKGESRLEQKETKAKTDEKLLEEWRSEVFRLDGYRCQCCGCKVIRALELVPNRAEAHHLEKRENRATRYDVRNGLTLCKKCHGRVTGAVNDRLFITGTQTFVASDGRRYLNARKRVRFTATPQKDR